MDLSNLANPANLGMDLISGKRPTAALLIPHPLCIHTIVSSSSSDADTNTNTDEYTNADTSILLICATESDSMFLFVLLFIFGMLVTFQKFLTM